MILTDPMYSTNDLLMKPYAYLSKIKTFHTPIDPNLTPTQLSTLLTTLHPKRLICPHAYLPEFSSHIHSPHTVIESLSPCQTLTLSETQLGKLKYMGLCPVNLANLIKQKNKISRINGLEIEFKDQKYQVTNVYKKQDSTKSRDKLFFKIME